MDRINEQFNWSKLQVFVVFSSLLFNLGMLGLLYVIEFHTYKTQRVINVDFLKRIQKLEGGPSKTVVAEVYGETQLPETKEGESKQKEEVEPLSPE